MAPDRREILERVARGELSPEDADTLLGGAGTSRAVDQAGSEPEGETIRRVRIESGFGAVSVVGDADVREAEVDGVHSAAVDGDTLVISGELSDVGPGIFQIQLGGRRGARRTRTIRTLGVGRHTASALRVRVNPSLEVDVRLDAGPVSISAMRAPIRARASAGPITIEDVDAPMDVAVNAGAIRINGRIVSGESRVRSDAGGIRIELEPSSNVHVVASAALGKVVLPGMENAGKGFGSTREVTVGDGGPDAGVLRVETAMGSIHVSAG